MFHISEIAQKYINDELVFLVPSSMEFPRANCSNSSVGSAFFDLTFHSWPGIFRARGSRRRGGKESANSKQQKSAAAEEEGERGW